MAKLSSGANTRVSYCAETVPGTVNASPAFISIPTIEFTNDVTTEQVRSKARQADRMLRWSRSGNKSASAKLSVEYAPEVHDYYLSTVMRSDWVNDVLKIGVKEFSTTFVVAQEDQTPVSYQTSIGMQAARAEFTNGEADYTTLNIDYVGIDGQVSTVSPGTPTNAPNIEPFYQGQGVMRIDGVVVGYITNFNHSIDDALAAKMTMFRNTARGITAGMVAVTGSFSATFENLTLTQKWINNTPVELEIDFVSGDGTKKHTHRIPKALLMSRSLPGNTDGVLDESFTFEALYDETDESVFTITRDYQ